MRGEKEMRKKCVGCWAHQDAKSQNQQLCACVSVHRTYKVKNKIQYSIILEIPQLVLDEKKET